MKRIEFIEAGFRVVAYNPRNGWVAYIYDNSPESNNSYFKPIMRIQGLRDKQDALLKIGAEIRYLEMQEINPLTYYAGETKYIKY